MLSEKIIKNAEPKAKAFVLWDSKTKGFGCRIFPKGQKSYVIMYRVNGVRVMAKLSRVEDLKLEAARTLATQELLKVRQGDIDLSARRKAVKLLPTMKDLWAQFETEFVPDRISAGRMARRTFSDYRKQYRRHIEPDLGAVRVADVSRGAVEKLVRRLSHVPMQRNRTLALLSRLMNVAEQWEMRPQHTNPCRGVVRAKENIRDRILAPSEMQRLNVALIELEHAHPYEVAAINVAALTGLRISECLSFRWENLNFEMARVVLPTTKTGQRVIPLAGAVLDLLASLLRVNGSPFIFPSLYARRGPCAVTYKSARNVFAAACDSAGLNNVRLHDLRRSLATYLAGAGVNAFVLRDVLGHSSITMSARYVQQASGALIDASESAAAYVAAAMEQGPQTTKGVKVKRKEWREKAITNKASALVKHSSDEQLEDLGFVTRAEAQLAYEVKETAWQEG